MNRSGWKSIDEMEFLLRGYDKLSVISCGTCANLSGTGGTAGLRSIVPVLEKMGKKILFSRCIIACCPEELMWRAMKTYRRRIRKTDAIVVLSCAAGIKSANLVDPGYRIPIVSLLDSVGSSPVINHDYPGNALSRSLCRSCGHCVLSLTGGICPVDICPSRSKYGPCPKAPAGEGPCAMIPGVACVWREIEKTSDAGRLRELSGFHRASGYSRFHTKDVRNLFPVLRGLTARAAVRMNFLSWIITLFK